MVESVVDAVEPAIGALPFLHVDVGGGELCLLVLHGFHLPVLLDEVLDRNAGFRIAGLDLRESAFFEWS